VGLEVVLKIYLIAGEASGDNIGAKLMLALRLKHPDIEFYGVGGDKMQAVGMNLLFPAKELALMGFFEIVPHIPRLIKRINQTAEQICKLQPDAVITIDSPGFCFRVAKKVKDKMRALQDPRSSAPLAPSSGMTLQGGSSLAPSSGMTQKMRLIHYVAPTVWAYRPERAKKIAQIYDHLLVILPFEPEYFIKEGLATTFVGHPAIENLEILPKKIFRDKHNVPKDDLLICLAPGSRVQEIKKLLPIFLQAIRLVSERSQDPRSSAPLAPSSGMTSRSGVTVAIPTHDHLKELINSYNNEGLSIILVGEEDKQNLFSSADIALTKSGTITTELAFYKMPMVVAHKVNGFSYWLLKKMIKVKYATIINILAGKELIPELLQERCNSELIAKKMLDVINSEVLQKEVQINLAKLQVNGELPSNIAAKKILELISN
jgi:lipid-A-disaccharide synthase